MEFHRPHETIDETVDDTEEMAMRLAATRHAKAHKGGQPVRLHVEDDEDLNKEVAKPHIDEGKGFDPMEADQRARKFFVCDCGWKTGVSEEMLKAQKKGYDEGTAPTTYSGNEESDSSNTYGSSDQQEEGNKYK